MSCTPVKCSRAHTKVHSEPTYRVAQVNTSVAMDPPRSTTREERARRRAEEALESGNRELARRTATTTGGRGRDPTATTAARGRGRDNTKEVREGVGRGHQGGMGGGCGRPLRSRNMEHAIPEQDEVEVLEVVVRHHSDQAVEEVRDVAEEEVEGIVEEAGLEDLAGREVVELVEEVDGEGEVEHIGVDEADMEEELIEQDEDLAEEAEVDQVMVEAQDDDAEGAQDDHAELDGAQVAEVDSSAEPPLSNTIDLTDSPQPSRRYYYQYYIYRIAQIRF